MASRVTDQQFIEVRHPGDGSSIAKVPVASAGEVERCVAAAYAVKEAAEGLSLERRADALTYIAGEIAARAEDLARVITAENGKPLKWARVEVARASSIFRWAAEEARRWSGSLQRLDTEASGSRRIALIRRFPFGPVLGITPFNFPLQLVAHKVAPALAVGAPVIVKPSPKTPLSAIELGAIVQRAELPEGMCSVLAVPDDRAPALVADPRLPVVSFTGSDAVGWAIRDAVPRKEVFLELGGNAAVIIAPDWASHTDLAYAADRIATFSNYQAGQACVSVQRVYVPHSSYEASLHHIVAAVEAQRVGSPWDESTDVGPPD